MATQQKILIADDDRLIRQMLSDLLAPDFEILVAEDGQQALDLLEKEEVVAVLSDQVMPEVTGVEVLRKCIDMQPQAVRILITATDNLEALQSAVNEARVHRFVVKPVREVEFAEMVKGAIREQRLAEENARLVDELKDAVDELRAREQELERELEIRTQELKDVIDHFGGPKG